MKKTISLLLVLVIVATMLCACGKKEKGDALEGTWTCNDEFYGDVTWKFDGKGKCVMSYMLGDQEGTYTINGDKADIKLDWWDESIEYAFAVTETTLKLTATNGYSPDYDLTAK